MKSRQSFAISPKLAQAKPDEDVVFNVKGYGAVAFDIAREKYWTSGRVFYANDKLNLIIGSYQVRKDRGKRQAEGAYGVLDDYSDLNFDHGGRDDKAKMPGRIVTTPGVQLRTGFKSMLRPQALRTRTH